MIEVATLDSRRAGPGLTGGDELPSLPYTRTPMRETMDTYLYSRPRTSITQASKTYIAEQETQSN